MRLNKNQRDGLAKICDNLTTAFIITAVLGSRVEARVSSAQAGAILMCAIGFANLGDYFRKEIGDGK